MAYNQWKEKNPLGQKVYCEKVQNVLPESQNSRYSVHTVLRKALLWFITYDFSIIMCAYFNLLIDMFTFNKSSERCANTRTLTRLFSVWLWVCSHGNRCDCWKVFKNSTKEERAVFAFLLNYNPAFILRTDTPLDISPCQQPAFLPKSISFPIISYG